MHLYDMLPTYLSSRHDPSTMCRRVTPCSMPFFLRSRACFFVSGSCSATTDVDTAPILSSWLVWDLWHDCDMLRIAVLYLVCRCCRLILDFMFLLVFLLLHRKVQGCEFTIMSSNLYSLLILDFR
jgi:hypothetical protein